MPDEAELSRLRGEFEETMPVVQRYVQELKSQGVSLSMADLTALALQFASKEHELFYKFLQSEYPSYALRRARGGYVPPSAMVVSTEQAEAGVAAVLGIGIGWIWIWVAVSPWATAKRL